MSPFEIGCTAIDFAHVLRDLADLHFPSVDKITLVQDNLNTHKAAYLYKAYPPAEAAVSRNDSNGTTPKNMDPGSVSPNANSAFSPDNASLGASLTRQL